MIKDTSNILGRKFIYSKRYWYIFFASKSAKKKFLDSQISFCSFHYVFVGRKFDFFSASGFICRHIVFSKQNLIGAHSVSILHHFSLFSYAFPFVQVINEDDTPSISKDWSKDISRRFLKSKFFGLGDPECFYFIDCCFVPES